MPKFVDDLLESVTGYFSVPKPEPTVERFLYELKWGGVEAALDVLCALPKGAFDLSSPQHELYEKDRVRPLREALINYADGWYRQLFVLELRANPCALCEIGQGTYATEIIEWFGGMINRIDLRVFFLMYYLTDDQITAQLKQREKKRCFFYCESHTEANRPYGLPLMNRLLALLAKHYGAVHQSQHLANAAKEKGDYLSEATHYLSVAEVMIKQILPLLEVDVRMQAEARIRREEAKEEKEALEKVSSDESDEESATIGGYKKESSDFPLDSEMTRCRYRGALNTLTTWITYIVACHLSYAIAAVRQAQMNARDETGIAGAERLRKQIQNFIKSRKALYEDERFLTMQGYFLRASANCDVFTKPTSASLLSYLDPERPSTLKADTPSGGAGRAPSAVELRLFSHRDDKEGLQPASVIESTSTTFSKAELVHSDAIATLRRRKPHTGMAK